MTKKVHDNNTSSRVDTGHMYKTRAEGCPVDAFKKYIQKLNPKCDALFQTPMTSKNDQFDWELSRVWYKNCPVGEKNLGDVMAKTSKAANLLKCYTNHSLRTTCIQILDEGGFATLDICNVSGHTNERSLQTYVRQPCDAKKKKPKKRMSDTISSSTTGKIPVSSPGNPSLAASAKTKKNHDIGHPSTSSITNLPSFRPTIFIPIPAHAPITAHQRHLKYVVLLTTY